VSFDAITPYVASQRVFIVVSVYFVLDSVRKLLDTPSYVCNIHCITFLLLDWLDRSTRRVTRVVSFRPLG
jgi:hypothetical protein